MKPDICTYPLFCSEFKVYVKLFNPSGTRAYKVLLPALEMKNGNLTYAKIGNNLDWKMTLINAGFDLTIGNEEGSGAAIVGRFTPTLSRANNGTDKNTFLSHAATWEAYFGGWRIWQFLTDF